MPTIEDALRFGAVPLSRSAGWIIPLNLMAPKLVFLHLRETLYAHIRSY